MKGIESKIDWNIQSNVAPLSEERIQIVWILKTLFAISASVDKKDLKTVIQMRQRAKCSGTPCGLRSGCFFYRNVHI